MTRSAAGCEREIVRTGAEASGVGPLRFPAAPDVLSPPNGRRSCVHSDSQRERARYYVRLVMTAAFERSRRS